MTPLLIKKIDKANHFIVGGLIYCLLTMFIGPFLAYISVAVIAALKELIDMYRYKHTYFDVWDFVYTIIGAIPPSFIELKDKLW